MKFEFDSKTGMMVPKKDEQIYFSGSMGGGLRIDDKKNNVKFVIERDGRITNISGIRNGLVNLYSQRDAMIIANRVVRMFGKSHKYSDYHYFLRGYSVGENRVLDFENYVNEFWGAVIRRDMSSAVREEDKFHNKEELEEYLKKEIKKQGKNVVIKNLDVSGIEDLSFLFYELLDNVKTLNLSGWNMDGVKDIRCMFYECDYLTELNLSGWNSRGVENMISMFADCYSLESLDLSGWDISSVKTMAAMFNDCRSLQSLDLSGWNTSSVEDMSWMFSVCKSLNNLDLSGWNTDRVNNMSGMFAFCNSLVSLDLSGWNMQSVIDVQGMFYDCPAPYKVVDNKIVKK